MAISASPKEDLLLLPLEAPNGERAIEVLSQTVYHLRQKKWTGLIERKHMKMVCYESGERERNGTQDVGYG
jgi:hypothetical protein